MESSTLRTRSLLDRARAQDRALRRKAREIWSLATQRATHRGDGPRPRRPYLSWLALGCSALLTLMAWSVTVRSLTVRLQDQFVQHTDQITNAIARRMQEHESVLRGAAALFLASDQVTRHEFHEYVRHLQLPQFYPGILGVGFAPLAHREQIGDVVARVHAEGYPSFGVEPRGVREWYTPIVYIEPFVGPNLRAFGYDMFSEQHRRRAMERAWHTREPALTSIVKLVQDTGRNRQPGFLVYLPVFRELEASFWRRQSAPLGFVYSPLRTRDLMQGILGDGPDDLDFALYDEDTAQPFYDTRRRGVFDEPGLTRERELELPGRRWRARFWTRPNFERWTARLEPALVLVVGGVINLLLFWALSVSASLHSRAHALAEAMTDELKLAHGREQAQMRSSLREKETLLKEIHHRVKNNLQVVSSLLSLQRSYVRDERALEPLRQSQSRVLAMAALHEFLYRAKELSHVDTRGYLTHLVGILAASYESAKHVRLSVEVEDIPLDVDHAIPCGLITNELVSNALKYAFADRKAGELRVSFRRADGQVVLTVADDGPGLKRELDVGQPETLGLQLVQLLSQQLDGTFAVRNQDGAQFEVRFPATPRTGQP